MKLFGIIVAQNEGDIIVDLLEFLGKLNIYEAIFLYDLGSEDNTFVEAQRYKDLLYKPQILNEVFTPKLKYDLLLQHHKFYKKGDWLAIIDADEFYVDNPKNLIEYAESEYATSIKTYQAEFMLTDADLENIDTEDQALPIYERRKFYLIDWSEERFYKFLPDEGLISTARPCSRRLLNRHYQYRTPPQIKLRIKTRLQNRTKSRNLAGHSSWTQIFSRDWKDYIVSHKLLFEYDHDGLTYGIPEGIQWKDYFSKHPKSHILPQVALLLKKEKSSSEAKTNIKEAKTSEINKCPESSALGSITFKDRYGEVVLREILDNAKRQQWAEFFIGIKVLLEFYPPVVVRYICLKLYYLVFKVRDNVSNLCNNLKRVLLGQSTGWITADPNPIEISDFSGMGETTLTWKSNGTARVEIRMNAPDGQLLGSTGNSGNMKTGKWVRHNMIFYLQDVSHGLPLSTSNTIATVKVKLMTSRKITI